MAIRYEHAKPLVGAIVDADKAQFADAQFADECRELLEERTVLIFPEANLSDEEQIVFSDLLGMRSDYGANMQEDGEDEDESSEIYQVTLDPEIKMDTQYVYATWFWHMDGVTAMQDPPAATLISARNVAGDGGQTEFASTIAAYETLPDKQKAMLGELRASHSVYAGVRPLLDYSIRPEDWDGTYSKFDHPLVWTHESGRKSLVLGVQMEQIVGMKMIEARAMIQRLMEWATQPDFKYRHNWQEGDLVMWKNLGAMHRVAPYKVDSGRMMHRTSLARMKVPA
ncbi:MAG: TauD/TfdA family dioxygenase [Novosphingobium sp.]|nr:TauD/TfdA family dioxygenase [Novosphingobium sp.]